MALEASPLRTLGWKVLICRYRFVSGRACVMLAGHLHQESLDSCWGRWSISGLCTSFICQSKFSLKCKVYFEGHIVVVVSKAIKLHWNVPFCSSVVTEMAYQQNWLTQKMSFFFFKWSTQFIWNSFGSSVCHFHLDPHLELSTEVRS